MGGGGVKGRAARRAPGGPGRASIALVRRPNRSPRRSGALPSSAPPGRVSGWRQRSWARFEMRQDGLDRMARTEAGEALRLAAAGEARRQGAADGSAPRRGRQPMSKIRRDSSACSAWWPNRPAMPQHPTLGKRASSPRCVITVAQRAAVSGCAVFSVQWSRMSSFGPAPAGPAGMRPAAISSARNRSMGRTGAGSDAVEYSAYSLYSPS